VKRNWRHYSGGQVRIVIVRWDWCGVREWQITRSDERSRQRRDETPAISSSVGFARRRRPSNIDQLGLVNPASTESSTSHTQPTTVRFAVNPLIGTGNCGATSNNMTLVHWQMMSGLVHVVQRGWDWARPQPTQACPVLAVPNVTAHPSTASVPITVLLYIGPLFCGFNVSLKGLGVNGSYWMCNQFVELVMDAIFMTISYRTSGCLSRIEKRQS